MDGFPPIESCVYTPFFCEENIWKLCEQIKKRNSHVADGCYAVFVSNESRAAPLWNQKRGQPPDYFVVWDYHVLLVCKTKDSVKVLDFDATTSFPEDFMVYCDQVIRDESCFIDKYRRKFRVIPAEIYLKTFASDRSHMMKPDETFIHDPPPYPPIACLDSTNNIDDFISMDSGRGVGQVFNSSDFIEFFTRST